MTKEPISKIKIQRLPKMKKEGKLNTIKIIIFWLISPILFIIGLILSKEFRKEIFHIARDLINYIIVKI